MIPKVACSSLQPALHFVIRRLSVQLPTGKLALRILSSPASLQLLRSFSSSLLLYSYLVLSPVVQQLVFRLPLRSTLSGQRYSKSSEQELVPVGRICQTSSTERPIKTGL